MTDRLASSTSLADALDHEWQHLAQSLAVVELADGWRLTEQHLASLNDLLVAIGYRQQGAATGDGEAGDVTSADADLADVTLRELVRVAATDQLAGRVVLQRILPGLRAAARTWWHGCRPAGVDPGCALDELVGAAWEVIASYDVERRPRHVAGNLIRAAVDRAFVGPSRRRAATEQVHDPVSLDAAGNTSGSGSASAELLDLLVTVARDRDTDREAVALLCDLVAADGSTATVAAQHGVSARAIRARRAHAVAHVRDRVLVDTAV